MQTNKTDSFADGARRFGDDAAEMANGADGLVHELGAAAVETGKAAIRDVKHQADEMTKDLTALYADGAAVLRDKVSKQPIAAIGLAMLAGAVVSNLLLRK